MRFQLFSIRDNKAGCFLAPFVARTDVDAQRQLTAGFRDPRMKETPVGQNPGDFDLYSLGSFEDDSGEISVAMPPRLVTALAALVPPEEA